MNRQELIHKFLASKIFEQWHWFSYHFNFLNIGYEHHLVKSILDCCLNVEIKLPGYSEKFVSDLASFSGIEKHLPHYEQLLQKLSELYVINKAAEFEWEIGTKFYLEPTVGKSKKNPEINIETPNYILGIEVKCPSLVNHINVRQANPFQLSARSKDILDLAKEMHNNKVTLPRDNPVKDFLISANEKFESFKKNQSKPFFSVLFIVWDDYIYEPVTALTSPYSGLLTDNSFYKDKAGNAIKFPFVDSIVLLRNLRNIINATRDEPLIEVSHSLEYTSKNVFPPKVFITVNNADNIPLDYINAFELYPLEHMIGAEYKPSDGIFWI